MGVFAPAAALADQLDLGRALPPHLPLDEPAEHGDRRAGHLRQRRPLVAEDPRVAVLVGGERPA